MRPAVSITQFRGLHIPLRWLVAAGLLAGTVCSPVWAARLALVVGNDSYVNIPKLKNARNDAHTITRELESAGFKVTRLLDLSRKSLNEQFDAFLKRVEKGDEVVFFFSGHGSQPPQMGPFLLPVDIDVSSERAIARDALSLEQVVDDLNKRARFTLVIVDACRDDPFRSTTAGRSLPPGSSLSRIEPPKGTMIIMAASKGQQALDRLNDRDPVPNGLFTRELVKQMRQPGLSASEMLKRVRANVETAALTVNHAQRPALIDESSSEFFFYPARGSATAVASPAALPQASTQAIRPTAPGAAAPTAGAGYGPQLEFDAWEAASQAGSRSALEDFIRQHPDGRYTPRARSLLAAAVAGLPVPVVPTPSPIQPVPATSAAETAVWEKAASSRRRADYDAYLAAYPDGRFAEQARQARTSTR
jgi:uncharacterized caspase-like protein